VLPNEDVGEARVRQLAQDVLADPDVLEQVVRELVLPGPPVGLPVVDDADAESAGVHLLAHQVATPSSSFFAREARGFRARVGFVAFVAACSAGAGFDAARRRVGALGSGTSASTRVTWHVRL